MPTTLPPRRREQARSTARMVFDIAFNCALLLSAAIFACVVLVRSTEYSMSQQALADLTAHMIEAPQ